METLALRSVFLRPVFPRILAIGVLVLGVGTATPTPVSAVPPERYVFELPAPGPVLRGFDPPEQTWLAGHRGVDLDVEVGQTVHAAGAGVVAFAGVVVSRPVLSIDHPSGIRTTYEPVEPLVTGGESVERGQVIGVIHPGDGHCQEACLHWGARIGRDLYLDPMKLLNPPRFRLYPPEPW